MSINLHRTIKWLDKTEGRDKFCKVIQYACRFLKYREEQKGNIKDAKKISRLFDAIKDARKLFRLFKSFKQYTKLLEILQKRKDMKVEDLILSVITRVGFLLYWLFDNLAILSKIKILQFDVKKLGKKGSTFWFIALLSTAILSLKTIITNLQKITNTTKQTYLKNRIMSESKRNSSINEGYSQTDQLRIKNLKQGIILIKTLGDMLPAGQGCEFYSTYIGFNVNEGYCGLGGLISAIISSYDLYQ